MAYVVSVTNSSPGTSSSQTPTLPTHTTNDLLLEIISQDGGGTTIATATSGWAMLGTQAASGASRMAIGYKVAASSSETNPTFTGDADQWIFTQIVIRDAHASPFGSSPASGTDYVRVDWSGAWFADSGSLTTGADDCLLIFGICQDTDNDSAQRVRTVPKEVTVLADYVDSTNSAVRHLIMSCPAGPSGSTAPTVRAWLNDTGLGAYQGGNFWTIAVRNKSGGLLQPAVKAGVDVVCWYGHFTEPAFTLQSLDNFAASIGGISTDNTAPSDGVAPDPINPPGTYTEIRSSLITAGAWVGRTHTITSRDMSSKSFALQWEIDSRARIGANGWCVGFSDGTNWVVYQLSPLDTTISLVSPLYNVIALGNATALYSSGSINWAAVTRLAYMWHRDGSSGTQGVMKIKNAVLADTAKFVGGGAASQSKFSLLSSAIESCNLRDIANLQGSGQTMIRQNVQVGDGSTKTYFDMSAQSLEYPAAYDATSQTNRKFNFTANGLTIGIYPSANDTLSLTAGIMASAVQQALTVNASASTSATVSTAGSSFVGWTPTWKTGIACNSATFKQCGVIDFKGADVTNLIISNGTGTACATVSTGFSDTNGSYTASTTAVYGLRIAAAGTYDLDGTTFSGFTKDIDVTATTGTVTINLASGTSTPTYQTAGATVTIVSSPVFQSVTISNLVAGSRVQIYDTTSSTELANATGTGGNIVFSGGGTVATWTDPSAATASRAIRVRIAYVSGTTAKTFIEANIGTCTTTAGSQSISYVANQVADSTYNTNAIDGPSVYAGSGITFTDAATDRVNCNIAGGAVTYATIYACFVYWNFTSTGIANDFTYIDAPDIANYLLSGMKIRNNSATDLTVTGGWGRDATTGLSKDIIDTAGSTGNIFLAPDHVIPYSTGSGLTAGQAAELTAAASSSATAATKTANLTYSGTALQVDIQKVLGTSIQAGSSSTASIGY